MICDICKQDFVPQHQRQKYCSPECSGIAHREAKRRWQRDHSELKNERQRRYADKHRHPCPDCGKLIQKNAVRCLECGLAHRATQREVRRQRIAAMWAEGFSLKQIAGDLGSTPNSLNVEVSRMRTAGYDLPYRKHGPQKITTKAQCRDRFHNSLEDGTIRRPARCEECGEPGHVDGHHSDYSRPLYVHWLCRSCHMALHSAEKAAA